MQPTQIIQRNSSFLLLIDIQERLAPAIDQGTALIACNAWILQIANQLGVPVVVSEQYPQGLGTTVAALQKHLTEATFIQKTHFGLLAEDAICAQLNTLQRAQVIVTGTEAHVCVLQSSLQLLAAGFQVFVVEDAVGSRVNRNKVLALQRMRDAGCVVVSSEMVAFEWLHKSATDEFRHISKTYLR